MLSCLNEKGKFQSVYDTDSFNTGQHFSFFLGRNTGRALLTQSDMICARREGISRSAFNWYVAKAAVRSLWGAARRAAGPQLAARPSSLIFPAPLLLSRGFSAPFPASSRTSEERSGESHFNSPYEGEWSPQPNLNTLAVLHKITIAAERIKPIHQKTSFWLSFELKALNVPIAVWITLKSE